MGRKPKGDDVMVSSGLKVPKWLKRQIDEQGGPKKVLLPLVLPHFKKEEEIGEKTD